MTGPANRKILFYGTCQMQVLAQAYEIFAVPHTGDIVTYAGPGRAPTPAQRAAMAQADIHIDQITPMGQPKPDGIGAGARVLRVPLVDGSFLWPFSGARHPDSMRRYGAYHPFMAEFGDSWLLKAMAKGASPDDAVAAYMKADVAKAGHADRRREMALDLQTARETGTPYRFAPLIDQHFRTERLFRTPYHLEARLQRHMLLTLLDDIGVPDAARHAADRFATRSLYLGSHMPVHPGIAAHFGLTWTDATTRTCFWREDMLTFEDYARRFAHCEAYPEMDIAVDAVMRAQPDGPTLLHAALEKLPASPWGLHAQAVLHLRDGRPRKALMHLNRVVRLYPAFAGVYATLHDCLMRLGRDGEALDALREEIRRQPHRVNFRLRLAQHLRSAGQVAEAVAEADCILMLQPDNGTARKIAGGAEDKKKPGGRSRPPGPLA
jgi:tetratricopeptide (TPR) repeat protein